MNFPRPISTKELLALILGISMLFGSSFAQETDEVVADTGEKPTKDVNEAPVADKTEDPQPATDKSEDPEPAEEKTDGSNGGEAGSDGGDAGPAEDEETVKRAKPVNSETIRVFGWVEWSEVADEKLRMKARLDTGAKTSSLHAEDVELFERDGVKWVKFTTVANDDKRVTLERPLKRIVRIRKAGDPDVDKRYAVELKFSIDGIHRRGEFTLSERDHMNYPVLVGRNLLSEFGLVDARRTFIAEENIEL